MLRVSPTTKVLAVSRWLRLAWTVATTSPAAIANINPMVTRSVMSNPTAAANAPARIMASVEMFSVPARSAMVSPRAQKASSAAKRAALE